MKVKLKDLLREYTERNSENMFKPVAVGRKGIRLREDIYSKELASDYSKNKVIFKNTLVVGMGSKQIDIGILTDDVHYSVSPAYHTFVIQDVDPDYLRYLLEQKNEIMFELFSKKGSRQGKTIDFKRWLDFEIYIDEKDIQLQKVRVLDLLSNLIERKKQQISLTDQLTRSRFIEMFSELDTNEKTWPLLTISQICNVRSSKRIYQSDQSTKGIPFWKISDLTNLINLGEVSAKTYIPVERYLELEKEGQVPKAGDMLITSRGTIGQCYIVKANDKFYFQDGMISWLSDLDRRISPLYLSYLFTMPEFQKQIDSTQAGSTVAYLSIAMIKKLRVMVPDRSLQDRFIDLVKKADKSKLAIQKSIDQLEILKKKLMQEYFG